MALFNQVVITKRGRQLIADATASQKHITFTTVKTGAGVYNITARKPMVFRPWDEWR